MADSELQAVIHERMGKIMELYSSGDMKGLAQYYTEDCKIMPPGAETAVGRKAAEDAHVMVKTMGISKMLLKSQECGGIGDGSMAYDQGNCEMVKEDGTIADVGKYLVIWEKVDGEFQIKIDCFNSNTSK